ncbi:MAG: hypothetical protein GF317_01585 [Candidatus Lokiarchaeota archaeon]|nr:hypothetical protein [Candidatus Lokiarchaeota archaeon]MBD3198636.1 hypothetical protein [Candidatus Lokiarchaeota archaeon]
MTTVVGSGIWRVPLSWSNIAGIMSVFAVLLSWLLFLTVGLSCAECVSMLPKSGGPYSYVGGAFNKKWGTTLGMVYFIGYLLISSLLAFLTANFTLGIFGIDSTIGLFILTLVYIVIFGVLAGISSPRILGFIAFGWGFIKVIKAFRMKIELFENCTKKITL